MSRQSRSRMFTVRRPHAGAATALLALVVVACVGQIEGRDGATDTGVVTPPRDVASPVADGNGGGGDAGGGDAGDRDGGVVVGPPQGRVMVYTGWPFDATEASRRQGETARALGLAREVDVNLGAGVALTFVVIPAGESVLGCTDAPFPGRDAAARCEGDERIHNFRLPAPLLIGKTVFTVAQFNALAPTLRDDQHPLSGAPALPALLPYRRVQDVVRPAVQALLPSGWTVRLPNENEWEHASRAGVTTYFTSGNSEANLAETAWYGGNSGDMLHEVLRKMPNAWGVHDVLGNAWSWAWYGTTGNYTDSDPTTHLVRSCPYWGAPLYNDCRLSNRNVSTNPAAFRFVIDVPAP
jgi:hypothetical protein